MSEIDNLRKSSYPPVVEVQEGLEATLANVQNGEMSRVPHPLGGEVEVDTRDYLRQRLIGERAVELFAQKGELLGIVTKTDTKTGEKTPVKVIDLSNEDFGTEVFLDPTDGRQPEAVLSDQDPFRAGTNQNARSAHMDLPKGEDALKVLFDTREEAKATEEQVPRAAVAPEVLSPDDPGANYRAKREKVVRARQEAEEDEPDNTHVATWMIGPPQQ
jgi:hypothetical protein